MFEEHITFCILLNNMSCQRRKIYDWRKNNNTSINNTPIISNTTNHSLQRSLVDINHETNLEKYSIRELLQLFKLPIDFNETELRRAKHIAQRMHPDYSKLPMKYFEFFTQAYQTIEKIHQARSGYQNKYNNRDLKDIYEISDVQDRERHQLASDLTSRDDFLDWFNSTFDKTGKEKHSHGYDEWFRSTDQMKDTEVKVKNIDQINKYFESEKSSLSQITPYREVREMNVESSHFNIDRSEPTTYTSSIFSKLQYEDLKVAHTETIIPVCTKRDKHKSLTLEELKQQRTLSPIIPTIAQSNQQCAELARERATNDTARAYNILKQDEDAKKKQNEWWSLARGLK